MTKARYMCLEFANSSITLINPVNFYAQVDKKKVGQISISASQVCFRKNVRCVGLFFPFPFAPAYSTFLRPQADRGPDGIKNYKAIALLHFIKIYLNFYVPFPQGITSKLIS